MPKYSGIEKRNGEERRSGWGKCSMHGEFDKTVVEMKTCLDFIKQAHRKDDNQRSKEINKLSVHIKRLETYFQAVSDRKVENKIFWTLSSGIVFFLVIILGGSLLSAYTHFDKILRDINDKTYKIENKVIAIGTKQKQVMKDQDIVQAFIRGHEVLHRELMRDALKLHPERDKELKKYDK